MAKAKKGKGSKNTRWLQEASERMEKKGTKGAFTKYCKSKGYKGVTQECINEAITTAKRTGNKTLLKRAIFAKAVKGIAKRRKAK